MAYAFGVDKLYHELNKALMISDRYYKEITENTKPMMARASRSMQST